MTEYYPESSLPVNINYIDWNQSWIQNEWQEKEATTLNEWGIKLKGLSMSTVAGYKWEVKISINQSLLE